jgi:phage baseplate assembly protein gpV
MNTTSSMEIGAALADLVSLAEKDAVTLPAMLEALKALVAKSTTPVVNVAAPNVNVAAPNVNVAAPAVNVTAQAGQTIVKLVEPTKKKVSLKVHYNDSGRIDTMDVVTVAEG